jgi:hypothetical protein
VLHGFSYTKITYILKGAQRLVSCTSNNAAKQRRRGVVPKGSADSSRGLDVSSWEIVKDFDLQFGG